MRIANLHSWDLTAAEAVQLQKRLARRVRLVRLAKMPRLLAGLDCAFSTDKKKIVAAAVVVESPDWRLRETAEAVMDVSFPYVPGLLSFREAPVCLEAMRKLRTMPEAVLVDGQGVAHPRRLGLASHLGLFLDIPAVGCAKSRLIGEYEALPAQKGAFVRLLDGDEQVGFVVRTRRNVRPIFVSAGHKITHFQAVEIVLHCCGRFRLPEPTRLAHQRATRLKKQL